jgi:hypothetical protein
MRVAIQSALQIAAAIFSTSTIAAEISSNELPTGDVWPSQATPHGSSHAGKEEGTPAIPLPPARPSAGKLAPTELKFDVPTEFKFDITLTIRPNDKPLGDHAVRSRRPVGFAYRGDCRGQKFRMAHCHG